MATQERNLNRRRIDATQAEIDLFVERLGTFFSGNLEKILKDLKDGKLKALEAAKILGGLSNGLMQAGLEKELRAIEKVYGVQMRTVNEFYQQNEISDHIFADADYKVVEQLVKLDTRIAQGEILKNADQVASVMMRKIIVGEPLETQVMLEYYGKGLQREIRTEIETTTSGYYRSITQAKAKEVGLDYFVYLGPDDGITRPFCKARVNKIFTRSQISKWSNGTDLSAAIYAGGYNCRHDLVPLTKEKADSYVDRGIYSWG